MGLKYYYTFFAPGETPAEDLLDFLNSVEVDAKKMGFEPTMVLKATFDTPERREFSRRIVRGLHIEDERLKGVVLPDMNQLWDFSATLGYARLAPDQAVILIATNGRGVESVFGFAKYPKELKDINNRPLLKTLIGDNWHFRDFVDCPDERIRRIVKRFADAGFLETESDEF